MATSPRNRNTIQVVNRVRKNSTIKRYIHYYELLVGYNSKQLDEVTEKDIFIKLLENTIEENENRTALSFFPYSDRTYCIEGLVIDKKGGIAYGKLCAIRGEDFPQLFNTNNGKTRDLDALESEGLVEFTHFVINYNYIYPHLAIEYNQVGGKMLDLVRYLQHIGVNKRLVDGIGNKNILNNSLDDVKEKIGRISRFIVKVKNQNIDAIRRMEEGLGSILVSAKDQFNLSDVEVNFKFDYKYNQSENSIARVAKNLINRLVKNPQNTDLFEKLEVDAENLERDSKIQAFDLLMDKVRSEITATKDGKNRTVISNELLPNMILEMKKLGL